MKYLVAERIKLFSTRSPYWCLASIFAAALLFCVLMSLFTVNGQQIVSTGTSQAGMSLGMTIFLVLGALSTTTEYRFGTIRTTFLAAPNRVLVFGAKTLVVMVLGALIAVLSAFAAFFLMRVLAHDPSKVALTTGTDWRFVLGNAAVYPLAGVIAIAVGAMIRHSAGAIAILLVWAGLIEGLVMLIPNIGVKIAPWMPFNAAGAFTTDRTAIAGMGGGSDQVANMLGANWPTPLEGLGVFAAVAVVLWLFAAFLLTRRDA